MKRFTLLVALMLTLAALPAFAQHGPRHRFGHHGRDPVEALGFTEEQQEQWKALHEAHRAAVEPLFEQLRDNHRAVESAIESGDPTAVGEAVLAAHALREQLEAEHDELEQALVGLLDEEQQERWRELRERRHGFGPAFRWHGHRDGSTPDGE